MTDRLDLDELERLAKAATGGPWTCDPGTPDWTSAVVMVDEGIQRGCGHMQIAEMGQSYEQAIANAAYIASLTPQTSLALLARLRAAEAEDGC